MKFASLRKTDGVIFHCHFGFWRECTSTFHQASYFEANGTTHGSISTELLTSPTLPLVFTSNLTRELAKESESLPPKKKLTSTENIHLEIKLSRFMCYNNLITSPPPAFSASSTFCCVFLFEKKIPRFSLKTRGHRGTPGAP